MTTTAAAVKATTRNHQQIWNYRWKIKRFCLFAFNHHFPFQLTSSFISVLLLGRSFSRVLNKHKHLWTKTVENKSIPFIFVYLFALVWNCECAFQFVHSTCTQFCLKTDENQKKKKKLLWHHYYCQASE